jgi:predicted lipoprotein with Yx(FWY)xxD motif
MPRTRTLAALLLPVALVLAACGPGAGATPGLTVGPTLGPTEAASEAPTEAPSEEPSEEPSAAAATIVATDVGDVGTILVAGSNGMTLYTFTEDTPNSGTSACTGGCITAWPALTVAAGETPSAGDGISGTLGTITRADDGSLQVTYNGLPLYFFANDEAPGDTNGIYDKWEVVAP